MGIEFSRTWAMPNGATFTIKPIKEFVEKAVLEAVSRDEDACIVDPFARDSVYGTVTNDINREFSTHFHMDALEFLSTLPDECADCVLYDPPYSITQAKQLYDSHGADKLEVSVTNMRYWKLVKDNIARITKPGGTVLSFGWNTNGCGKGRGFYTEEILIVHHGGSKNDTLCMRERKGEDDG